MRRFLAARAGDIKAHALIDELFPHGDNRTQVIRAVLDGLTEDGDTPTSLFNKYIDYSRSVPQDPNTVRIMSLMASKGLQAEHVYVMGCNSGNIPGPNRSVYLTDAEHREEQLRLLYVGFTRATRSLTVSWAREIPFSQARGHNTPAVRTLRRRGQQPMSQVGISEFLQALDVDWE